MALGAKDRPLAACPLPAPKLNGTMNTNLLRMLLLEPLQLAVCLLVVRALTLKLRCKAAYLSLKCLYLRFRIRQAVECKRKTLADYVRNRQVFQGVSGNSDKAHGMC